MLNFSIWHLGGFDRTGMNSNPLGSRKITAMVMLLSALQSADSRMCAAVRWIYSHYIYTGNTWNHARQGWRECLREKGTVQGCSSRKGSCVCCGVKHLERGTAHVLCQPIHSLFSQLCAAAAQIRDV